MGIVYCPLDFTDSTHCVGYEYDNINNLTALVETINGVERKTSYTYDEDNRPTSVIAGNSALSYTYVDLGRVSGDTANHDGTTLFNRSYSYRSNTSSGTSAQPYQLVYTGDNFNTSFGYGYNSAGNIAYTNVDGIPNTYKYDSANQLIRENNRVSGLTTTWTYDNAGNILKREVYPYTGGTLNPANRISEVIYTYGDDDWGDLLTAYNGVPIAYDEIGNPLNDGTWTYTWQHGRQLASMAKIDGSAQWNYTYNADGLRTQRTNGTTTYNYTYLGSQLTYMTVDGHTMYFAYDAVGVPMTLTYDGVTYYYVTNLQGDVVAILDASGAEVVSYAYDAWGNLITADIPEDTLGFYNPLRYRGYVYDEETELYYLQSRYYDPEMGRFINADGFVSTGQSITGYNMFAYCGNNPVNRKDPTGQFWITALIVTAVVVVSTVALSGCSVQPTSDVGAASPYSPSNSTDYNCYAYALGEKTWKYVGGSPDAVKDFDVDNVAEMVLLDAKKDSRSMRIIDSYDSPIENNEYRIALRTGKEDYHFMLQHNDGSWSHKPGFCSTRLIDGANPSIISWDAPQVDAFLLYNFGIVKEIGSAPNYYDSRTIYFAVSK